MQNISPLLLTEARFSNLFQVLSAYLGGGASKNKTPGGLAAGGILCAKKHGFLPCFCIVQRGSSCSAKPQKAETR